jgi:cholesterol oxidase
MADRLASPLADLKNHYDVVVVGSGYGGGIAACRLARARKSVCVLERGAERRPGDYPDNALAVLKEIQIDAPGLRLGSRTALFDVRYNKDINVVVGCGLGGTSQINAGICLRPDSAVFASEGWPAELQNEAVLDPFFDVAEAMLKPAVAPNDYLNSGKTVALKDAATKLHESIQPVPVLVNFQPLPNDVNHVGVTQTPCIGCGDCVSGCNHSAKNTVIMNYLPDAKAHSAQIFTRTHVRYVEKMVNGWRVCGNVIDDGGDAPFETTASIVILAAGTLGSTEILLRSRENGLSLSSRLGCGFSGNGDTIGFAYNTNHVVNGIGLGVQDPKSGSVPGPCSTAKLDLRRPGNPKQGMVIEDGAIPGALASLLAPLLAVGAKVLGSSATEGVGRTLAKEARELESAILGAYSGADRNTLFLLLMAHDDSLGRMYLEDDKLRVDWPGLGIQPQFEKASTMMERISLALGGIYIPNPIWNALTNHNMVTGHPLGGCSMADDAERGVVNHKGQVFGGASGNAVHAGLYVMDGSVVPAALGVNPLLTISALAERNCQELANDYGYLIA